MKSKNESDYSNYKFLDWQNGWQGEYLDEEGNATSDRSKARRFTHATDKNSEYKKCVDSGHVRDDVQITQSGSKNIVSCDECKYYYFYDCS